MLMLRYLPDIYIFPFLTSVLLVACCALGDLSFSVHSYYDRAPFASLVKGGQAGMIRDPSLFTGCDLALSCGCRCDLEWEREPMT